MYHINMEININTFKNFKKEFRLELQDIAKALGLTPCAISKRMERARKYGSVELREEELISIFDELEIILNKKIEKLRRFKQKYIKSDC